uniref:protein DEFECTIVE IN MERISTEM SILENCING 3-like n=1 Tax=Fragaria vesca subsp. vesca TaxID=101020 RepID=UPI0005CA078E|nr:PREDICTED: protein DEFECTIVE IN MERISTEM SILENCING 3-like [Fragaria vesca subsp. vesca]XP_011470199.1 PREDICTED: protein DEFECTIVE IN MERISTEM SILENCING 3-like [Fragaria vesca subsp. vesca]XP_011470200.1 PREDICTED: protein DEFECTIVE IN MERISTEM SILENCING 3-like [Fragaria vesca subsp. vesca]XP_011470201.1 PREDICTED: protein DEFECTIVE IN MERISTEM SILENCING 3-like [Fragaria vesca subsp. vesca]
MEADTHMLKVPVVQPVTDKYEHLLIKKEKQYESPTPWEVSPLQEFAQQVGILRVSKISNNQFMGDVIGLVAQLGTIGTGDLSRVLAEYLGQDQMLAIVCRSFEAAGALEKFVQKPKKPMRGEVDSMHFLCEPALLQKPTHGRSFVFCLEDIRPYTGDFDRSDPQRKLALPDPVLPSGMAPDGFLGYAVNMVDLDSHHIHTVTSAGHGLRETVLYCLLGELQVYDTREDMLAAHDCIKHGAISLGGGILKQNGVTSFGVGDVEICFSVAKNLELLPSTNVVGVEKQIEEKSASGAIFQGWKVGPFR